MRLAITTADVAEEKCPDVTKLTFMAPSHERKVHFAKRDSSSLHSISLHACQDNFLRETSSGLAQPLRGEMLNYSKILTTVLIERSINELFRSAHTGSDADLPCNPELSLGADKSDGQCTCMCSCSQGLRVPKQPQVSSGQYPHMSFSLTDAQGMERGSKSIKARS